MTPDITGPSGKAYFNDLSALSEGKPHAGLIGCVVVAPRYHPLWHSYYVSLIHLRPLEGFGPPIMHVLNATHELVVHAIDPDWDLDKDELPTLLTPPNFAAQFVAPNDSSAISRVHSSIVEICNGFLNPDTDALQQWIDRYGNSMIRSHPGDKIIEAGDTTVIIGTGAKITKDIHQRINKGNN